MNFGGENLGETGCFIGLRALRRLAALSLKGSKKLLFRVLGIKKHWSRPTSLNESHARSVG
jgi:hypothetical protein